MDRQAEFWNGGRKNEKNKTWESQLLKPKIDPHNEQNFSVYVTVKLSNSITNAKGYNHWLCVKIACKMWAQNAEFVMYEQVVLYCT